MVFGHLIQYTCTCLVFGFARRSLDIVDCSSERKACTSSLFALVSYLEIGGWVDIGFELLKAWVIKPVPVVGEVSFDVFDKVCLAHNLSFV